MAHTLLKMRVGEEGVVQPITIKDDDDNLISITWAVLADTEIIIKDKETESIQTTITNSDFTFGTSIVNWTPTETQITTDLGVGEFWGYVHLKDNGNSREEIAKFELIIEAV